MVCNNSTDPSSKLAYLAKHCPEHVDAIAGSSELLLFDVDRVITKFNFETQEFTYIKRQHCVEELGGITADAFIDACMLSGCDILPTLPPLATAQRRGPRVRQALDMMRTNGQTGLSVCLHYQDEPKVRQIDYVDRYRRSRLALKHQIVLTQQGKVEPMELENAPGDLHELIGQRLPDELYYYLSVGAIGPRVLNQLTSNHVYELCPADGGDSEAYRSLVSDKLNPMRQTTLSLLAHYLFRSYLHRNIQLSCWYAPDRQIEISLSDATAPKPIVEKWLVRDDVIKGSTGVQVSSDPQTAVICTGNSRVDMVQDTNVTIKQAMLSLRDAAFAPKTMRTKEPKDAKVTGDLISAY